MAALTPKQKAVFQSPPSVRRATFAFLRLSVTVLCISIPTLRAEGDRCVIAGLVDCSISIPTLRAEGDAVTIEHELVGCLFQSPPSVRRATLLGGLNEPESQFQSPPSVRRATCDKPISTCCMEISIPTLRAEGDIEREFIFSYDDISIPTLRAEGDL